MRGADIVQRINDLGRVIDLFYALLHECVSLPFARVATRPIGGDVEAARLATSPVQFESHQGNLERNLMASGDAQRTWFPELIGCVFLETTPLTLVLQFFM